MKVIFLDFDGVLCNPESITSGCKKRTSPEQDPYGPHADCVAALNYIIGQTGAVIVVSSVWRKCKMPNTTMRETLNRWGVQGQMVGCTPVLGYGQIRGDEIQLWIETARTPVTSFVILDDDSDMGALKHRLVRTDFNVGLTQANAELAVSILNAPPTDLLLAKMFREVELDMANTDDDNSNEPVKEFTGTCGGKELTCPRWPDCEAFPACVETVGQENVAQGQDSEGTQGKRTETV